MIVVQKEINLLKNENYKTKPLKVNNSIHKSSHSMITKNKYVNINNQTYKNIINSKINNDKIIARQSITNNKLFVDYQTYMNFIHK